MIDVVSAVVARDGRLLLAQRPPGKDFAFDWESPGGKVDPGESHAAAVARELREELGLKVSSVADAPLFVKEFHSDAMTRADRRHIRFLVYVVRAEGAPAPREGQGFGWFTSSQARYLRLSPGTAAAFDRIAPIVDASRGAP